MVKKEAMKRFSCLKCGTPFDAYPPDDKHDIATRNENDYKDHIRVDYRCKDWQHQHNLLGIFASFLCFRLRRPSDDTK